MAANFTGENHYLTTSGGAGDNYIVIREK